MTRPSRREIERVLDDLDDDLPEPDREADPPEVGIIGVMSTVNAGGRVQLLDVERQLVLVNGERHRLLDNAADILLDDGDGGVSSLWESSDDADHSDT